MGLHYPAYAPLWPSYYGAGKDIHTYIDSVADQHDLRQYVKTGHKAIKAQWLEDRQDVAGNY